MILSGVLLALHLLGAAAWVGGLAFVLLVLRPALAVLEPPQRLALHRETLRRFFRLVWHVMPLVLATGYAMIFVLYGGFAHLNWAVNVMHALGLLMTALFLYVVLGPWRALRARPTAEDAARIRRLLLVSLLLGAATLIVAAWAV
jgi:uncharacterized membrane protein